MNKNEKDFDLHKYIDNKFDEEHEKLTEYLSHVYEEFYTIHSTIFVLKVCLWLSIILNIAMLITYIKML